MSQEDLVSKLKKALLEKLHRAESDLKRIHLAELQKADPLAAAQPVQNPSLPNPAAPDLNGPPDSPVGAANQVPVGQLGVQGQAEMETGGGMCPLCGRPDLPGQCQCLQSQQAAAPAAPVAAPQAQPLAMSEGLAKVAPPGRESQVKALKPKVGDESAFKIAWASYDKKHGKKNEKGESPGLPTGMNLSEDKVKKNAGLGYGAAGQAPARGAMKPAAPGLPTQKDESSGGATVSSPSSVLKAEPLCKECGLKKALCKCMDKSDYIDQQTGKKVEKGVVGKVPPKASGIKEISAPGSGSVLDPKKNDKAVKKTDESPNRQKVWGDKANKERQAAEDKKTWEAHSKEVHAVRNKQSGKPWLKAEPPMAKPPSGKNPATMTPAAQPAAPKAGAIKAPKAPQPKMGTPKAGSVMGLGKAALPAAPKAQMQQHSLITGSKAASGAPAPVSPLAGPRQPLQYPGNMGRAHTMQSALSGVFQPKGPVHSGLELARSEDKALAKSELGNCVLCNKQEHDGDC